MEKYLGVKIVQASKQFKVIKDSEDGSEYMPIVYLDNVDDIENNENRIFEGYKVVYEDGYTSWSPKDVFEKAYRKLDGITFGLAIEALNMGMKIKVPEWKGYWFKKSGMVMVMTAEGEVLDTPHFQQYIFREDWIAFND